MICETCGYENDTTDPKYDSVACRYYASQGWAYPIKDKKRSDLQSMFLGKCSTYRYVLIVFFRDGGILSTISPQELQ